MPSNFGYEVLRDQEMPIPDLEQAPTSTSPLEEIGGTGVKRAAGIIDEEFLPALRGRNAVKVYREMSLNDPIVGAMLFAIDKLCRQVTWRVEGNDNTEESSKAVEFVEQCMDDMCYDDQTQILTDRGWLRFAELTPGDLVAQRTGDGYLEYVQPRAHHVFDYDGQLHQVQGQSVDLVVSPNHRLLFAPQTGRTPDRAAQKRQLGIHKAADIHGKRGWMSKQVSWKGTQAALSDDALELMGFAVADGCFSGRQLVLIQHETQYVEDLLARNGMSDRVGRRQVNGSTQWTLSDIEMVRSLQEDFGLTSRVKKIPSWLQEATPSQISAFLVGFDHGDGYTSPTGLTALYTSSAQLADDLQVLAMKTGRAATVLNRTGSPTSFSPGSAQYRVSIWSQHKEHTAPYIKPDMWSMQDYTGKIYCVSVPSGVIMVRRNGKAVWSGNSHTWNDMVSEALSMLVYGWSWHEIVYKKRVGPWEKDPKKKSKYTDGLYGWRKIPIRSQETLLRWLFDEDGGIQGLVQIAPPYYKTAVIPVNKSLLFRTGTHKGNPEGMSILRNSYRPWFFKKRLEEFEAIGVERDLAGLPVAKVPASYMNAPVGSKEYKVYQAFKKMVQNVRRDEHEGLVLPLEYDIDTKQPLFEFELMSSGGARTFDTNALIQRYEQRILMSTLADFILVGHEGVGSYSMHVDKTGIFRAAMNVITDAIADVFNRHAIPRLFEINAWKLDELPRIVPNNVDPPNLVELSSFMSSMGGLGMQFFPDPDLEKFLRETAHLPEIPEDMLEQRRQMAMQNNAMMFAQSQMEFMGAQQKAQAVEAGMTPEQAQLASETPDPSTQENQVVGEQVAQARAQAHPEVQASQQQQMEMAAQDPQAQAKLQADQQGKELDAQGKQMDLKVREKDHAREQSAKDKDVQRDDRMKTREEKHQAALLTLKEKMATSAAKAKEKADKEVGKPKGKLKKKP